VINKLLILFAFLISNNCYGFDKSSTQLILSPSLLHFDYTEFSTTNKVLDRETGWLPGVEARLNHALPSDWSIGLYTSYYQGTVNYDGQTQSGTPHTTDTGTEFFRLGAQLEKIILANTGLFISAQTHQWERDIHDNNNISGITETYDWIEYSAGINYGFYINNKDFVQLNAGLLITRNAEIYVDLSRVNLGSTTLDIGDGTGGRLKLDWSRQHSETMQYGLGLFFEAWDFGRSNTRATEGGSNIVYVTEPRSETRNIGLMFNFKYLI
jgi:hypothetical protein